MARGELGVNYSELGTANVTVCVLDVLTDLVIHLLAHLCGVVDLVFEDLEHVGISVRHRALLEVAGAGLSLDLLIEVRGWLEDCDYAGQLDLDQLPVLS